MCDVGWRGFFFEISKPTWAYQNHLNILFRDPTNQNLQLLLSLAICVTFETKIVKFSCNSLQTISVIFEKISHRSWFFKPLIDENRTQVAKINK